MSYGFPFREAVDIEFRAIAFEEIRRCQDAVQAARGDIPHEIRKHCKRLHALLRLVRGSFPDHARVQRAVRDAGRELAVLREVAAHREALARLRQCDSQRYGVPELERAEAWLAGVQQSDTFMAQEADAVQRALHRLGSQRDQLSTWTLEKYGFSALSDGLAHTYRQGRQRLAQVLDEPTADNFHELRKYVKHHRFHLELLQSLWKRPIGAAMEEAERLGEWLGQHHDLHVLAIALGDESRGADKIDSAWLGELMQPQMARLERHALRVARCVYAEKPSRVRERFGAYWETCARRNARRAPAHATEA